MFLVTPHLGVTKAAVFWVGFVASLAHKHPILTFSLAHESVGFPIWDSVAVKIVLPEPRSLQHLDATFLAFTVLWKHVLDDVGRAMNPFVAQVTADLIVLLVRYDRRKLGNVS